MFNHRLAYLDQDIAGLRLIGEVKLNLTIKLCLKPASIIILNTQSILNEFNDNNSKSRLTALLRRIK